MQYLYIDESGSMTIDHFNDWPYFVIAIVRCGNPDKLKTLYKRFIKKHMNELHEADTKSRMFQNERFHELKGSAFTPSLKSEFVSYFAREGTLEVYYIVLDNARIAEHAKDSKNILIFYNYSSYFSNLQISSFCKKTKAGVQPIGRTEKLYSRFA